ncbi:periplasmic alpha-amylase [Yersinia aldovae]|nr:periplasmic alpha-amylase [Yersinia aldovae]
MHWNELTGEKGALLTHWQKVSQFRARHPAIGSGVKNPQQPTD